MDSRIAQLRKGQSVEISRTNKTDYCTAERSGKGDVVRFVRHTANGSRVFRTVKF